MSKFIAFEERVRERLRAKILKEIKNTSMPWTKSTIDEWEETKMEQLADMLMDDYIDKLF